MPNVVLKELLEMPNLDEISESHLPSEKYPSDHLLIMSKFLFF